MDFNFDTGAIYDGLQILDVSVLPPLGGQAGVLTILGDGALTLPEGDTTTRPALPAAAMIRFNTDTTLLEYYDGTQWNPLSTSSSTVSSVAANSNSSGLTITGSPITSAGTFQFTLDAGLQALSVKTSTGLMVQTGADTYGSATITGTAGNITVSNGDGVAGNPTLDLATVGTPVTTSFVKITTDAFGRVSATTPVVTSDITALVDGTYVNVSGDTMTGNLSMGGNSITNLAAPVSGTDAVNKDYVDATANGLSWKQAVVVASTANIDLTTGGLLTVDGVTVADGDRVLVKNQTSLPENGIYVAHAGAWVRSTDMDSTTPINEVNGAATFVEQGTSQANTAWVQIDNVVTIGTDPIQWSQFAGPGSYTAGTGLTLTGNQFSLSSPVAPTLGGTGTGTAPTAGQILIGTSGNVYTPATLTAGTAISITSASGSITIDNTGVTSLTGTANQITASSSTGAVTLSLPSDVTINNSLTVSGLTANSFVYSGTAGLLTTTSAPTNGQLLIGSTGAAPVAASITAGSGITVTPGAGSITIAAVNAGTVTSVDVSGGTTGLTTSGGPITSSGTITLAGTLSTSNGGTGLTSLGTSNQILGVNNAGTALEYKNVTAGTGISVVNTAGVITINNTGVTSVALADGSTTPIYTITGSPVTTTGTLTFSLASQTANTAFLAPNGSAGQPGFRAITYADLPLALYVENPVTPVTPVATGDNAVAIGSGSDASIYGSKAFANGVFTTSGDAQAGLYVLRNITTTNSSTVLYLDGTAGTQLLVVGNNSVWTFDILVTARRTDATGGGAGYRFVGVVRKDTTSGSITFVGTPSKTVIGETNASWDAAVTANTTGGDLRVSVTGENAKTIRWVAVVNTAEVTG